VLFDLTGPKTLIEGVFSMTQLMEALGQQVVATAMKPESPAKESDDDESAHQTDPR
jgi:hypothetical protein